MSDTSMRDKVVTQIMTDLWAIKKTNGYHHTVLHVEELKDEVPSSPTTPSIYFIEGVEKADETNAIGYLLKSLNFGVTFVVRDSSEPGKTARKMLEDVIKAVQPNFSILDSASNSIPIETVENSNVYIYEERTSLIHLGAEFTATYKHILGDSTSATS